MPKADLSDVLVRAGGGTRRRPEPPPPPVEERVSQPSRAGTRPITVHFPREVRDQLTARIRERFGRPGGGNE